MRAMLLTSIAAVADPTHILRRLRQQSSDETGSIAVEFALIAPVLVALLLGIVEGGLLIHTWGRMEFVARQAARGLAIGEFSRTQAQDFVKQEMQQAVGAPAVVTTVQFASGPQSIDNKVIVNVRISKAELKKVQLFDLFPLDSLSTTIAMHREALS